MNKLTSKLSKGQAQIINQRAQIVADDIASEIETRISELEKKKRDITRRKLPHTDIGPDNSTSLRVVDDKFNSAQWVDTLMNIEKELVMVEIDIKIANAVKEEWLGATVENEQ